MKKYFACFAIIAIYFLAGCKKDNKEAPSSMLSGKIVYNKLPIGVRSNGVQLELWQYGYQLRTKIAVYVAQDGSYSAKLFDGAYKLTLLRNNGPWAAKTDSIDVVVKGATVADVTVDPYFVINNFTCTRSGNTLNASVTIQRVNTTRTLESVRFYIGQTMIVDQSFSAASSAKAAAAIPDATQPITFTATIPDALVGRDAVFGRIGVKTTGVDELVYSQPIELKK